MTPARGGFELDLRTRLVFGDGSVERLGELAAELGATRVLLVSDPGIVAAGHADRAAAALEAARLEVVRFEAVREDPTNADVERCAGSAREATPDLLVAVGGGSSIDTAKGANFLVTNGGCVQDYWGVGKASRPMLPLIAVPTTAGTGSEVQSFALIEDADSHQKMACGDPKAAPRVAVLDPSLTATQPRAVAACTGLDALTHAVETAVTTRRTPFSDLFSREAFRLTVANLPRVLADATDGEARGAMLQAAAFAGIAIENSMLGAAHSMANPLTARYELAHGQAVGMLLPCVVRFNASDPAALEAYRALAVAAGICVDEAPADSVVEALTTRLEELLEVAGMPASLALCGVPESAVEELAEEASRQWTAAFNPREVGAAEFGELYRQALTARR